MPNETELKLDVPMHRLDAIGRLDWLKRLAQAPPETRTLVSVYFDTHKRALWDQNMALRVRRVGDKYIQTIKRSTSAVDREEWEREISGEMPQRGLARATALKHFASKERWRKLVPIFETKVRRTSIPLRYANAVIEVALDKGQLKARRHIQPVSEIELELKDGDIGALARLAWQIAQTIPVTLNLRSKAERGYALADENNDAPVKAMDVGVAAGQNAAQGFTTIVLSCLQQVTANRAAILKGNAEGVHQMRIGLRRLRAALSLFKDMLGGREIVRIRENLKWLTAQLEPARDFDVFIEDEIARVVRRDGHHAPLKSLKHSLVARRDQGMARAKGMVAGDRYRHIVLETGLWAIAGEWARSSDDMQIARRTTPLPDIAREILKRRTKKVVKKLARLEKMDSRGRHKLRIAVKKLRYAVEFFTAFYSHGKAEKRRKMVAARLKALQMALGRLNDIRVHEQFARQEIHKAKRTAASRSEMSRVFGLGYITGRERKAVPGCIAAAVQAGRDLADESVDWR